MGERLAGKMFRNAFLEVDFREPFVLTQPGVEGAVAHPQTLYQAAQLFVAAENPQEMELAGTVFGIALKKSVRR